MYLSFYQLERKPFQISTDPKFLWLGEKHKEALAVFRYGLMDNKGFLLLTGDVGTGKTTLINALVNTLGEDVVVATLHDPGMEREDFFAYIGKMFNMGTVFSSKGDFLHRFSEFLNHAHDERKKVLLIIDEAQRLTQELLEEIRLLSNIERQATKLINIFFVGQIEFNRFLLEPKNSALRQRISVNYDLQPLSVKETGQYVRHRLKIAGAAKPLFNAAAIREIYRFSNGYPRLINVICDRALVTGYTREAKKISSGILRECARELKLQNQKSRPKKGKTFRKTKKPLKQNLTVDKTSAPPKSVIEKALYVILVLMLSAWVAIAVTYYYPFNAPFFKFQSTTKPKATVSPAAVDANDSAPSQAPTESSTVAAHTSDKSATKSPLGPVAELNDAAPLLQMPDEQVVIHFELDDYSELDAESAETIDNISALLRRFPELGVTIKGYSEGHGSYRYNKKMSEFTANIVKGYLVGKGIAPQRIHAVGMWLINPESDEPHMPVPRNRQWVEIQFKMGE